MGEFIGSIVGVGAVVVFILGLFARHAKLTKEAKDIAFRAAQFSRQKPTIAHRKTE